jgi:hypothetical protein
LSTAHRPLDSAALADWQGDPEIRDFNRSRFAHARRLSEFAPEPQLRRRGWYRGQFTEAGLQHCIMQDVRAGLGRARILAIRALGAPDFDVQECEFFERTALHMDTAHHAFHPHLLRNPARADAVVTFDFGVPAAGEDACDAVEDRLLACGLTQAEARIAATLADGCAIREGAARLGLSVNTVKTHLKRIYEKLSISRLTELVYCVGRMRDPSRPDD